MDAPDNLHAPPPGPSLTPSYEGTEPPLVTELDETSTGRWIVTTRGSTHLFDLDARTYSRTPGTASLHTDHDGLTVPLTRVERWPRVGSSFFIWVDDHDFPAALEHWHQSSEIRSISSAPPK